MDIKIGQEVVYCGCLATVKAIAEEKKTALISTPLFIDSDVWVPLSQLKIQE